jgi:hypothetical protein
MLTTLDSSFFGAPLLGESPTSISSANSRLFQNQGNSSSSPQQ